MARFHGKVGYAAEQVETPPDSGVYKDVIVEYSYRGDIVRNTTNLETGSKVNFDISIRNSISIVADAYARKNFQAIRYVEWNGVRWTVTSVEVQRPRLLLELGGVYNGPTP